MQLYTTMRRMQSSLIIATTIVFFLYPVQTLQQIDEDCPEPYGCCSFNASRPAHGPNDLGCCLNSEFGCCPDDVSVADGPYGEGCSCEETEFGCCPDEFTPAQGPLNEGCGCHFSAHGCCPDSMTSAQGENFTGCPCETFPFGCCMDGISAAEGPNLTGCSCNSPFGCCPDGLSPKETEDDVCSCESSKYGCCLDGTTEAQGSLFEGCPEIPDPHCHLPPVEGECRNYTAKWYYDVKYGGCSRFWFGGCDPGPNHFDDEESCREECVEPKGPQVCFLPKNAGSCQGVYNEWYFDKERKACAPFVYGGCLGNGNRFLTKADCEDMCTSTSSLELCLQPKMEGACSASYQRWYFDQNLDQCLPFNYSGCNGNMNRFVSEKSCENACRHIVRQKRTERICSLPIIDGQEDSEEMEEACDFSTNVTLPRWAYNTRSRRCVPFYYRPGCNDNENVFETKEECQSVCPATFAPLIRLPRGEEVLAERGAATAVLHINVRANPPASIQWYHNGRPLSRFDPHYTMTENYLQISKVSDFDAGTYVVKADNGIKSTTTSTSATTSGAEAKLLLIVYPLFPVVKIKAEKTLFQPGQDVMVPCEVRAYPVPAVNWYKVIYDRRNRRQQMKLETNEEVAIETYQIGVVTTLSQLVLRNASESDSGAYKCETASDYFEPVSDSEGISVNDGPASTCVDSPSFPHCEKIVEHHYCGNKYYAQYCCLSCTRAGFAPGGA